VNQRGAILEARTNEFLPEEESFRLNTPADNPFVPSSSLSVAKNDGGIDVVWMEDELPTQTSADAILSEFISKANEDVERRPLSVYAHVNLALALSNVGRYEEALSSFELAQTLDPGNHTALLGIARIYALQQRFDDAERSYRLVRKTKPNDYGALLGLAFILARQARFAEAIELSRQAIETHNDAFSHSSLALILVLVGKPREGISHLKTALRLDPTAANFHHMLGIAYAFNRDYRRAARSFQIALNLAPALGETVRAFCRVLLERGETTTVIELMTDYLERKPGDCQARELLADAYTTSGNYKAAFSQLTKCLQTILSDEAHSTRDVVRLMNNIAVCLTQLRDFDSAKTWFGRAIKLHPIDRVLYHNLAGVHFQVGEYELAQNVLGSVLKLFPNDQDTILLLALSLEEDDHEDEAIEYLRTIVRRPDAVAEAFAYLGCILAVSIGNLNEARDVLTEGVRRFPSNLAIINNLAYVHLLRGEVSEARSVLALLPNSAEIEDVFLTATRGMLLLWEGSMQEGEDLYRTAEKIARSHGDRGLANRVRQKMHLEIARAYIREKDFTSALSRIRQGLLVQRGNKFYRRNLENLQLEVSSYI
jgi:tetratricopeptide (TPR) repeat protein